MVPGVAPAPSKQLAARCRRSPRVMPSIAMRPTTSSALGGDGGMGGKPYEIWQEFDQNKPDFVMAPIEMLLVLVEMMKNEFWTIQILRQIQMDRVKTILLQVAIQKEVVLHHQKDGLRGRFASLSGPGRGHDVEARAGGLGMGLIGRIC